MLLLPSSRRNNETASAAIALGTINLCKCTQTFVNRIFLIAFLNGTNVCAQATPLLAFLKWDRSQGHIPPTENTHCKISSLTLRCSAIPTPVPTTINTGITGNLASLGVVVTMHCSSFYSAVHFSAICQRVGRSTLYVGMAPTRNTCNT